MRGESMSKKNSHVSVSRSLGFYALECGLMMNYFEFI